MSTGNRAPIIPTVVDHDTCCSRNRPKMVWNPARMRDTPSGFQNATAPTHTNEPRSLLPWTLRVPSKGHGQAPRPFQTCQYGGMLGGTRGAACHLPKMLGNGAFIDRDLFSEPVQVRSTRNKAKYQISKKKNVSACVWLPEVWWCCMLLCVVCCRAQGN